MLSVESGRSMGLLVRGMVRVSKGSGQERVASYLLSRRLKEDTLLFLERTPPPPPPLLLLLL